MMKHPQVLTYSGYYELGIAEVWDMIDKYIAFVKKNGYFDYKRQEQAKYWMFETINEQLRDHFYRNPQIERMLEEKQQKVLNNEQSSFMAAKDVLEYYFDKEK